MVIVYLWDAATWSGVSGSLEDAQQHAAARMGARGHGRIETAWLVLGCWSLAQCYERTGRAWTACRAPDGTVSWDPVSHERVAVAS
jgi:hypothetical protein